MIQVVSLRKKRKKQGRKKEIIKFCQKSFEKLLTKQKNYDRIIKRQINGPLVKRLRHGPLKAETGVRFSHGSPKTKTTPAVVFCFCAPWSSERGDKRGARAQASRARASRSSHTASAVSRVICRVGRQIADSPQSNQNAFFVPH